MGLNFTRPERFGDTGLFIGGGLRGLVRYVMESTGNGTKEEREMRSERRIERDSRVGERRARRGRDSTLPTGAPTSVL